MIAIDINLANRKYRGIGNYVYNLVKNLEKIAYPIVYITGPGTKDDFKKSIYLSYFESVLRLLFIPIILSKEGIKVFHGPSHLGIPLLKPKGVKYISTVHDLMPIFYKDFFSLKHRIIAEIFLKNSVFNSDKIITLSYTVKDSLIHIFRKNPEKIIVTYPGPTLLRGENIDVREKYHINSYFLAHIPDDPRKNAPNIIKAFLEFSRYVKGIELIFTGNHKNFSRDVSLSGNIKFLGFVPDDELFSLYKNAIGLVFPSFYEGFGFPVLDAFSIGIPVITSSIGATGEIGKGVAILVDPKSPDEIKDAMFLIFKNRKKMKTMKRRGLERSRRFSWENTALETIEVHKELL